jgi:predicted ATP-dependent serine protease
MERHYAGTKAGSKAGAVILTGQPGIGKYLFLLMLAPRLNVI